MTVAVRLEPADLAAMATRANTYLTDDGARAWYRNDVPHLIQEVVALRQEIEDVRSSLRNDAGRDLAESDAPLTEWLEPWKAQVTGLWEKAQVKKLRQELADAKQALTAKTDLVQVREDQLEEFRTQISGLEAKLVLAQSQRLEVDAQRRDDNESFRLRVAGLQHRVDELEAQLEAKQAEVQQAVMALQVEQAATAERARTLASQIVEILS